jgi:hypothetical protein
MKKMFLAAITVLSLGVTALVPAVAHSGDFHNGSSIAGSSPATRFQQTGSYQ